MVVFSKMTNVLRRINDETVIELQFMWLVMSNLKVLVTTSLERELEWPKVSRSGANPLLDVAVNKKTCDSMRQMDRQQIEVMENCNHELTR